MLLNKEIFHEPLIPVTIRDQTSSGNETKIREQKTRSFYKICRNVSRILRGIISITQDRRNFDRFCKATILSTKMFCICKCNSLFFIAIFVSNAKKKYMYNISNCFERKRTHGRYVSTVSER